VFGIEHFPDICGLFDRTDPYVQLIHDRQKVKTRTACNQGGTVSFEQILEFSRSPLSNILQVHIMDENNLMDKLLAEVEIDLDRQTYEESNDFLHPENVVVLDCFKNGKIQGTVKLAFAKNSILGDNQNKVDTMASATFLALTSRMAGKIPTHLVDKFFDPLIAEFEGSKVQVIQILQDNWVRVKVIESDKLISIKGCHLILPNGARWDGLCHPNIVRLIRKYHLSLESNKECGAVVGMNLRLNMDFQTAVQEGSIKPRKLDAEALQSSSAIAANKKKSYVSISEEYARRALALRSDSIGNAKPVDKTPTNGPPADPVSSARAARNTTESCATIETTNFRSPPNLNVSAEFVTREQAAKSAREGLTFPAMQRDVSPSAATSKKTCADISAEYVKRSRRLLEMNPQSPSNFSAPMHSPNDAACMGSIDSYVKISEQHAKRIWALNSRKESPSFFDTPTSGDDHFKVCQAQEKNNNEVMCFIFSALIFRKYSCSYSCVCVCIVDEFLRHVCLSIFYMHRTRYMYVACLRSCILACKIANFLKCLPVRQYSLSISDISHCLRYMCPLLLFHFPPI
jgi:hypothetical protein